MNDKQNNIYGEKTVSLITIDEPQLLGVIKLSVSKSLVNDFEKELSLFNKNNKTNKLNFNKFAHKLIAELKKINNNANAQNTSKSNTQNNHNHHSIDNLNQT